MHEVGLGKFDIKECRTEKFILQKLNYIHTTRVLKGGSLQKSLMNIYIVRQGFMMETTG
jgi:hypothetical protein